MSVDPQDLIEKMAWAAENDVRELLCKIGRTQVKIRRDTTHGAPIDPVSQPSVTLANTGTDAGDIKDDEAQIAAPMAGLCHMKPDPESAPYLRVGDTVEVGQTLCVIEAMKVMTAVPAPHGGRVAAILVADGTSVTVGTPLARVV